MLLKQGRNLYQSAAGSHKRSEFISVSLLQNNIWSGRISVSLLQDLHNLGALVSVSLLQASLGGELPSICCSFHNSVSNLFPPVCCEIDLSFDGYRNVVV